MLAIATGSWEEMARLKLGSAGSTILELPLLRV